MFHFPGATAPRTPNWNPLDDELQKGKASWVGQLPVMNESIVEVVDKSFRARLQGLQGIDEIVEDVAAILEKSGVLEDTFIIYTTDNGKLFSNDSFICRSSADARLQVSIWATTAYRAERAFPTSKT